MASINVKPTLKLDTNQNMPPPPSSTVSSDNPPRPILKVNTGSRQPSFSSEIGTPSEGRKIKIKLSSQPTTPAAQSAPTPTVTKSKAGRTSKPTAKLIESKKRGYDSDEDQPLSVTRQDSSRPNKMIKIKPTATKSHSAHPHGVSTPISSIKFKPRGEPVEHHPGDAYDSEASDREVDPVRESTFVLRVMPGASADYLKKAIADGTLGLPKQNGGADFNVQFLDAKQRRAMVTINGINYAAVLVHLPTITEAMKSWDRKNMMKNSDVTEMLLCFAEVRNEAEAKQVPLPSMVVKNEHKWPHGLTPPMHDAVHRRFRKTLSEKQWQTSAMRVAKLLEDDAAALESHVEFLQDEDGYGDSDDEEDAEGEAEEDYFGDQPDAQNDDMEEEDAEEDAEMLAALEAEFAETGSQPDDEPAGTTPAMQLEAPTPMSVDAITPAPAEEEIISEEDEDDDDDDDGEDGEEDVDEEVLVAERERKEKLDEIAHLNKSLEETMRQLTGVTAPIIKRRILQTKENLEKEIAVKKAALGLTDED
ncbi:TAFII55 protein conserved region-domain-containing protein [Hypomontagnella submonticulosa]|nr:TAFII55 protein conserved region-domain-containing protein [Hypomontagnella submonticulosa]